MKRDIREIFKNKQLPKKKLPNLHEDEFLRKLENFNKNEKPKPKPILQIFKIAVSIVLILFVGYYFLNIKINSKNESRTLAQVQQIEREYLKHIKTEWNNFIKLTNDKNLIKKYEEKLTNLDLSYQEISNQYITDKNNIIVIRALIENLKNRLELLEDIQQHINLLNKKNNQYENSTI